MEDVATEQGVWCGKCEGKGQVPERSVYFGHECTRCAGYGVVPWASYFGPLRPPLNNAPPLSELLVAVAGD